MSDKASNDNINAVAMVRAEDKEQLINGSVAVKMPNAIEEDADDASFLTKIARALILALVVFISVILFPIGLALSIKIINQYERAVIFRMGKVFDPIMSVIRIENSETSTIMLAATALRNITATTTLSEFLTNRAHVAIELQSIIDNVTDDWGLHIERVEITDVRLPQQMQRAMAAEAEADREAKAKFISAEGEMRASQALYNAAETISQNPAALQLRYLQTLNAVSAENNSTIIFPLPLELLTLFTNRRDAHL